MKASKKKKGPMPKKSYDSKIFGKVCAATVLFLCGALGYFARDYTNHHPDWKHDIFQRIRENYARPIANKIKHFQKGRQKESNQGLLAKRNENAFAQISKKHGRKKNVANPTHQLNVFAHMDHFANLAQETKGKVNRKRWGKNRFKSMESNFAKPTKEIQKRATNNMKQHVEVPKVNHPHPNPNSREEKLKMIQDEIAKKLRMKIKHTRKKKNESVKKDMMKSMKENIAAQSSQKVTEKKKFVRNEAKAEKHILNRNSARSSDVVSHKNNLMKKAFKGMKTKGKGRGYNLNINPSKKESESMRKTRVRQEIENRLKEKKHVQKRSAGDVIKSILQSDASMKHPKFDSAKAKLNTKQMLLKERARLKSQSNHRTSVVAKPTFAKKKEEMELLLSEFESEQE